MLRASQILPKLERAGGGGDCFRFFMFPLKNDRDEIGRKEWQAGGRQRSYQSDTFSKKRED